MIFQNSYVYPMSYPWFHLILCFINRVRNHNQNSVLLWFIFIFPLTEYNSHFQNPHAAWCFYVYPHKTCFPHVFPPTKWCPPPQLCLLAYTHHEN